MSLSTVGRDNSTSECVYDFTVYLISSGISSESTVYMMWQLKIEFKGQQFVVINKIWNSKTNIVTKRLLISTALDRKTSVPNKKYTESDAKSNKQLIFVYIQENTVIM